MKNAKNFMLSATAIVMVLLTSCRKEPKEPETGYLLGEIEASLCVGDVLRLSERFCPYETLHTTVIWFTANPQVVTVNSNGDITAVGTGQTDIFIVAARSAMFGVCHTTVTKCSKTTFLREHEK